MASLNDYATALQFRDVLQKVVASEVESARPRYQYALVKSIDRVNYKCTVRFPGDTQDVTVNMGEIQPNVVDQIVRIDGLLGDRFIAGVIGKAWLSQDASVAATYTGGTFTGASYTGGTFTGASYTWTRGDGLSWNRGDIHFNSGWGSAGGLHATVGSRYSVAADPGIMLGGPVYIPYRTNANSSAIAFATNLAASPYYEIGSFAGGDSLLIRRSAVSRWSVNSVGTTVAEGETQSKGWFRTLSGQTGWYNDAYVVGIYPCPNGQGSGLGHSAMGQGVSTYPSGNIPFYCGHIAMPLGGYGIFLHGGNFAIQGQNPNGYPSIASSGDVALFWNASGSQSVDCVNNGYSVWRPMRALSFTAQSNRDSKEDIRKTHWGLESLLNIEVVDFRYKKIQSAMNMTPHEELSEKQPLMSGVIAEDIVEVYPTAVTMHGEEILGVDYGKFTPLLIKSVQEVVKNFEEEILKLKERIDELKEELHAVH
jgi:hypothetical protein